MNNDNTKTVETEQTMQAQNQAQAQVQAAEQAAEDAAVTAEAIKKFNLLKSLKSLFEKLRKMLKEHKLGRGKSASLIERRMDEIQNEIEELAANNELSCEQLEKLCKITGDIVEKAQVVNKDNLSEIVNQINKDMELMILMYGSSVEITDENSVVNSMLRKFETLGIDVPEECKHSLPTDMHVVNNNGSLANNQLFLVWQNTVQEITFSYDRTEEGKIIPKLAMRDTGTKYEDIYDEDGKLRDGFSYEEKEGYSPEHSLMIAFCEQNKLSYYFDKETEIKNFRENIADKRALFFADHMDKVTVTNGGRIESQFYAKDCSFHVRDKRTGDLIVLKPNEQNNNTLEAFLYRDTESLKEKGKAVKLGCWITEEGKPAEAKFLASISNLNVSALLQCRETAQMLEYSGISEEFQNKLFNSEKRDISQKVNKKGREKVDKLKDKLQEINASKMDSYYLSCSNPSQKFTFLSLSDKQGGKTMSMTFDKDGNPQAINYKKSFEDDYQFVCSINSRNAAKNLAELREDKDFSNMFARMTEAVGGKLYEENSKLIPQKTNESNIQTHELENALRSQKEIKYTDTGLCGKVLSLALNAREISHSDIQYRLHLSYLETATTIQKLQELGAISASEGGKYKPMKSMIEFEKDYVKANEEAKNESKGDKGNRKPAKTERG